MAHRVFLLLLAGSWAMGQTPLALSREKEAALGATLAKEFRLRNRPLESEAARPMAERIGKRIVAVLPESGLEFTFETIQTTEFREPVSIPAGYIFVPAGFFLAVQNEDEFAGMLAHAMAHCTARHGFRQSAPGATSGSQPIPLIFMGGFAGAHWQPGHHLFPRGFLKSQREYELEADRLAVQSIAAAGYAPQALVTYVERTQVDPERPEWSGLPPKQVRIAAIRQAIAGLPATFDQVREEVRKLTEVPEKLPPTLRRPNEPQRPGAPPN